MAAPQAIQMFYFDKKNNLILNEEVFKILSDKKVSNKEVCVISIAGAFRQGKSFILNFLKRFLEVKYKQKKKDTINWLNPKDDPISGFSWQSGSLPHTTGILMWPEIFIAKLQRKLPQRDLDIAVILMDTQGCFDNMRTKQESAVIFALSVLISSVQIYNLKENIKQRDLEHLEFFSAFGQMVANDSEDTKSVQETFQKLVFLIRDWSCPYEKKYGFEGGQLLLEEAFNINDNPKELIEMKTNIKDIFTKISCCLLPHPGEKVACTNSFQGDVKDISPIFRVEVEAFVSTILAPEHLERKSVTHKIVNVKDLIDLIKICWKCFSQKDIPPVQSLYQAMVESYYKTAINEAVEMYKKLMENCKTRKEAEENKSKVLTFFHQKKKTGSKSVKEKYEKQLIVSLEELFVKSYESVIEAVEMYNEAVEMYKKLMENCKTSREAEDNKSKILTFFHEKTKILSKSVKEEYEKQLIVYLEELFAKSYESVIVEHEKGRSGIIIAGASTAAISGTATAGIVATEGILASAAAAEIVLVAGVTGLVAAASGFGIGVGVYAAVKGIRWIFKKKESPAVEQSTDHNKNISEAQSVHQNEISSSSGNTERIKEISSCEGNREKINEISSCDGNKEKVKEISSRNNPQREERETRPFMVVHGTHTTLNKTDSPAEERDTDNNKDSTSNEGNLQQNEITSCDEINYQREESKMRYSHNRQMAQVKPEIKFSFHLNNWLIGGAVLIIFLSWFFD